MLNRLKGARAYLCGSMDFATDGGIGWRRAIGTWLVSRGCIVLDPTDKPTTEGAENPKLWHALKTAGKYDDLAIHMKTIRGIDLRMVDVSDFLVVYLDYDQKPCGTWEEIFLANREKKPVLIVCKQGKKAISNWMFGTIPHQHIFDTWEQLHEYLTHVDCAGTINGLRRWVFFNWRTP